MGLVRAEMMENGYMNGSTKVPDSPVAASAERLAVFGDPPLIPDEDRADYDELFGQISSAVEPADIFEQIWVRDIVDHEWEILRLRRLKANLLLATAHIGLRAVLEPLSFEGWLDLVRQWAAREPSAIERVNRLLESAGLTQHAVMAETLRANLDDIVRYDLMTARAQALRNNMLREIELHRAMPAHTLRRTVQQIEDAQQVQIALGTKHIAIEAGNPLTPAGSEVEVTDSGLSVRKNTGPIELGILVIEVGWCFIAELLVHPGLFKFVVQSI
jgi:hypothetical protein